MTSKAPFRLQMNGSVKGDLVFKANFTPEVWTPMAGDGFSSWAASGTLNGVAFENAQLDVASEGIEMDVEVRERLFEHGVENGALTLPSHTERDQSP